MKKKLEADLMSIAHRILQLKNKSDINQLYLETQKLYEKLALLLFVEEHFGDSKPTIGQAEIERKIEAAFDESNHKIPIKIFTEEIITPTIDETTELIVQEKAQEELPEMEKPVFEQNKEVKNLEEEETKTPFIPNFELENYDVEAIVETSKPAAVEICFEDLIGANFNEDIFVKVESPSLKTPVDETKEDSKPISLNEKLSKGISIDLNDRIAFTQHLFGNSTVDYNRVLNQLITFDSFEETSNFIKNIVKPDYNNWDGKKEYEERFMEIIEKKFL